MNIINEEVEGYVRKYYKPLGEELKELRAYGEKRKIPIILPETEMLILSVINMIKPQNILEIGTAIGYSTLVMAKAASYARIVTIDNDIRGVVKAGREIEAMGLSSRIQVVHGEGSRVLEDMASWGNCPGKKREESLPDIYDLVFIDGGKSYYREFWDGVLPMVRSGSVILCDNVLMGAMVVDDKYDVEGDFKTSTKKMRAFLDHIVDCPGIQTSILTVGDGVSISYVE